MIFSLADSHTTLIVFFATLILLITHFTLSLAMFIAKDRIDDVTQRFAAASVLPPERIKWAANIFRFAGFLTIFEFVVQVTAIVGRARADAIGHAMTAATVFLDHSFWAIFGFYVAFTSLGFVLKFDTLKQGFTIPPRLVPRRTHRPTRSEAKAEREALLSAQLPTPTLKTFLTSIRSKGHAWYLHFLNDFAKISLRRGGTKADALTEGASDMAKLQSYHFEVGNSTSGPIGFSAQVNAQSRAHAVELLRKALPTELQVVAKNDSAADGVGIEYIAFRVNEDYVKASDIDDFEEAVPVHVA